MNVNYYYLQLKQSSLNILRIILEIMTLFKYFKMGEDKVTKEKNPGREDLAQNLDNANLLCSYFEGHVEKKELVKKIGKR